MHFTDNISSLPAARAKSLDDLAISEVPTPGGIKGIGVRFDFDVPPDGNTAGAHKPQPDDFPVRGALPGVSRKHLLAVQVVPVPTDDPQERFFRVPAFGPEPETVLHGDFQPAERPLGHHMPVVVGPAPQNRIEHADEIKLVESSMTPDQLPHLVQTRKRAFPGRLDEQFSSVLAEVLAEEIEPVGDVGDAGLLLRELQPPVAQELLDQGLHLIFQHVFFCAGDDEVIGVPHQMHLGVVTRFTDLPHGEAIFQETFQAVQGQVRQGWGNDSPDTLGKFEFSVCLRLVRRNWHLRP